MKLSSLFGHNMVLQQGLPVPVWGAARPGATVSVCIANRRAATVAGPGGRWKLRLDPLAAGGPYTLTIREGRQALRFRNVLVGEVWVASGQSNMEWPVCQAANAKQEIRRARHPKIRLFSVPKTTALKPQTEVKARWIECDPFHAGYFSAVAYFFGRELHQTLRVPVGLIHSSWGGTPAEAWTSLEVLRGDPALRGLLRSNPLAPRTLRRYAEALKKWEKLAYWEDPGNAGFARGWASPDFDTRAWKTMRVPGYWEKDGLDIDGAVWFRQAVHLPRTLAGRELVLNLGPIDDFDTTYFNGVQVGATGQETPVSWSAPRSYRVPGSLARAGRNVIAVRIFDHFGNGGFCGMPETMYLTAAGPGRAPVVPLAGKWRYKIELAFPPKVPPPAPTSPVPEVQQFQPALPYNAMLAPLLPYGIRGAIWYQGESNASRAHQYRALFPAMIRDWRRRWEQGDFPFLFVQLANFGPQPKEPADSTWAELREAQTMTLALPNTGMAVTIDIGEHADIHPLNKQEVGRRLALAARAQVYGQPVVHSGPRYETMQVERQRLRLFFRHAHGGLVARSGALKGFAVAGVDRKFRWARARIDGASVVVWSPRVPRPVAARYAWADDPACNLFNDAGLPASPFRTDRWPGITVKTR